MTNGVAPPFYYSSHYPAYVPPVRDEPAPAAPAAATTGNTGTTVPLTTPAHAPLPVKLQPLTLETARAYTDEALATARASQQAADKLQQELGNAKPEDNPTGWTTYTAARRVADQNWLTVEQAMAAELRLVYKADQRNKRSTEIAADNIAGRYRDDPAAQTRAQNALKTVLTETPLQRESNMKLYDVHRTGTTLDNLMARKQAGENISDADIAAARAEYQAQQKLLLAALEKELGHEVTHLPGVVQLKETDLEGYAARGILSRYQDDPEFKAVLQAAVVIKKTVPYDMLGPEQQMKLLGELTPPGLDPTARQLIMSDPRVTPIIDRYVDWAARSVNDSYNKAADYYRGIENKPDYQRLLFEGTPPALAASNTLLQVTDFTSRPYVTPEMAARIINKLRTEKNADGSTGLGRIVDDLALEQGSHYKELLGKDNPNGSAQSTYPTYHRVITNLAFAVDSAARGSDLEAMRWDSPEIQRAVEGVGSDIAKVLPTVREPTNAMQVQMPPPASRFDVGFRQAASEGSVVLALEVAKQLRNMPADSVYQGFDGKAQADKTLGYVAEGINLFQQNTKTLFDQANVNMAPISSPAARFGIAMTEEQMQKGIDEIVKSKEGAKVVQTMGDDKQKLNLQGYRLIRVGESVQFYRGALGDSSGYKGVDKARVDLLNTRESANTIFLSDLATRRISVQTARMMLKEDYAQGVVSPQAYGASAQFIGDFAEFVAETYVLKGVNGQTRYTNLPLVPDGSAAVDATRIGHFAPPVSGVIWGIGGGLQVALTKYVYDNVKFDKNEEWRKPILMGLVGGFAAFHLWEAGVVLARMRPEHFSSLPRLSAHLEEKAPWLFVKAGTRREELTRHVVDATRGLTGALAGLMSIAVVWDLSGVLYRSAEGDWWKVGTHGANLVMDGILLRLQIREFTARLLPALGEGAFKSAMTKLSTSKYSLDLLELAWKAAFRKVPFIATNPIGILVNIGYLATTLINLGIDQNRYIDKLEKFDNMFLSGAGVKQPQADVLKSHEWFTGDGRGDGFTIGYLELGGDPAKFIDYINSLDPKTLSAAMRAAENLPDHMEDPPKPPDLPYALAYYLTLPADPSKLGADQHRITYSDERKRYEDSATHMYFENGKWIYSGEPDAGPGAKELRWYDPNTLTIGKSDGTKSWTESLESGGGLTATQTESAFLALPYDPTKVDVSKYTTITYNASTKRYEDPVTRTYWEGGRWVYDQKIGNTMGYVPPRNDEFVFYDPLTMGMTYRNGFTMPLQITSRAGYQNWLYANGVPMPPA